MIGRLRRWRQQRRNEQIVRAERWAARAARETSRMREQVAYWQREAAREHNRAEDYRARAERAETALRNAKAAADG